MTTPARTRCSSDLPRLLLAVAARSALWTIAFLVLWAMIPALLGWHVTTVHSDSMSPAIRTGDVVAAMPTSGADAQPGQVLLVDDPDRAGRLRLHRLQRIDDSGALQLRGDANPTPDRTPVQPNAVHGVGVLRIPVIGLPSVWAASGDLPALAGSALLVAALALGTRADRRLRGGAPCSGCGAPRWALQDSVAEQPTSPVVVAAPIAVLAAIVVTATGAGAVFSADTAAAAALRTIDRYPCFTKPLDNPVLAWDFDAARGAVRDRSGHGADGTIIEDVTRNYDSCSGNPSIHFGDSGNPRVSTTERTAAPSTFTVEAWFRTSRAGGRIMGFSSDQYAASTFKDRHLYVNKDGQLAFGVQGSSGFRFVVNSAQRVDDGKWHHAVGTFTSRNQVLYLDGARAASRTDNTTPRSYDGYWRAGRESLDPWAGQPSDYAFRGDIDSIRVYDHVLSDSMIAAHYAAGR